MPLAEIDCSSKCRSKLHYRDLIIVATQNILPEIILNYLIRCGNLGRGNDEFGRNVLHVCSSIAEKYTIVEWLLKYKKIDINIKNVESGYSALHCAVFYGQIRTAVNLIKAGALFTLDNDYLTPLDHVIRDTYIETRVQDSTGERYALESYDVYTFGENTNSNLGHNSETAKKTPEIIDIFRRYSICITKVKIDKFHTVFLADNGSVYSCGFGVGGRLGHDNEESVVIPKKIEMMELIKEKEYDRCVDIEVSVDNTYFLTEKGFLWSCGLNQYHQLGHPTLTKVLVPTKIQFRQLKDKKITKMACGRFHSALIVDDQLYTFGLNAGHLGHQKGEQFIQHPMLVTKFNSKEEYVQKLLCNDYAIICYTNKGDIYVLNDYKPRKIVKNVLNITELGVTGGRLDSKVESSGVLKENVGDDLKLFYLQSAKLYIWNEKDCLRKLCLWTTHQKLLIEHIAVGSSALIFTTIEGQAYTVNLDKLSIGKKSKHDQDTSNSIYDEGRIQTLTPVAVQFLHRSRFVTVDRKGRTFSALQYHPNTNLNAYPRYPTSIFDEDINRLFDEKDHYDSVHDIIVKINQHEFPLHRYILAMKSEYFRKLILNMNENENITTDKPSKKKKEKNTQELIIDDIVDIDMFKLILEYIYGQKCPYMTLCERAKDKQNALLLYTNQRHDENDSNDDDNDFNNNRKKKFQKSKKKKKVCLIPAVVNDTVTSATLQKDELSSNLDQLIDLSKRFQLHSLKKRLDSVKQSRQRNELIDTDIGQLKLKNHFSRQALPELYDVSIVAEDGNKLFCHKCILTSRMEYFHSMFLAGWMESQNNPELKMTIPSNLLEILIDYLYTDKLTDKYNIELLCQLLVYADQLLIPRLKEICEFHISNLITFRDAADILKFSSTYNAIELKAFVEQFICRNMATFLEGRLLDNVDDDLLNDLTKSYRNMLDCMSYRMITPYSDCPSLEPIMNDLLTLEELNEIAVDNDDLKKPKRKQIRLRMSEGDSKTENFSVITQRTSPDAVSTLVAEKTNGVYSTIPKNTQEDKWISVKAPKDKKQNKPKQLTPSSKAQMSTANDTKVVSKPLIPGATYSQKDVIKLAAMKKTSVNSLISSTLHDIGKQQNMPSINELESVKSPKVLASNDATRSAWNVSTHSVSKLSIQDVIENDTTPAKKAKSSKIPAPVSITATNPEPIVIRSDPVSIASPAVQSPIENPWSISPKSPPQTALFHQLSSPPPHSFRSILDDEMRQREALRQVTNKSFELIQIEEHAIQALKRLYSVDQQFDMRITVERVVPLTANPIWPRTPTTSSTGSNSIGSGKKIHLNPFISNNKR
ncbi:unnamed protein product [Didymodactylos carnosus]|uniref:BTB domain-containing protein n=1 Tax=Didymodactylos carnosus TaxID=1234261 RepID=A0A8S2HEB8_9BILA|nr:unnamed protein product [Didymodactylos carnosus]CAF3628962.1 unnamed protein product [Didymodactylos carnosus]